MSIDIDRNRRELVRWYVLVAINSGRPEVVAESLILSAIQSVPIQCTALELRRELDYLEERGLVELDRHEGAPWAAKLTRHGVDVVEYTKDVEPGIARPKKYW
jgi:hypothetical protein